MGMKLAIALVVVAAADYAAKWADPSVGGGEQVSVCKDADYAMYGCGNLDHPSNTGWSYRCWSTSEDPKYRPWFLDCLKTCGCCAADKPSYCPPDSVVV